MKNAQTVAIAATIKNATGVPVVVEGWSQGLVIHAATIPALEKATVWILGHLKAVDPKAHVDRVSDAGDHRPPAEAFFALVKVSWTLVKSNTPAHIERLRSRA